MRRRSARATEAATANVIMLSDWTGRHARASKEGDGARLACIRASASAVTPAKPRAAAEETRASQYSEGMRPLWAHLRIAETLAPMSDASSSSGHRLSTARGESVMPISIGRIVLNGKANLSRDCGRTTGQNVLMDKKASMSEEKRMFIARTKAARAPRYTQQKIALLLGIPQDRYKQYETRTPLPLHLIPKFVVATGVSYEWLLAAEGQGPEIVLPSKERKPRTPRRKVGKIRAA